MINDKYIFTDAEKLMQAGFSTKDSTEAVADFLHREQVKIGALDVGYLTGGQGEPLVIVHGGGDSGNAWLKNAVELSRHYQVYVPDLPGFGFSQPLGEEFILSEYVLFIEEFRRHLGLDSFHLIGHSLGGSIALHYALTYPGRVKRLVLISSLGLGKEIARWARFCSLPIFYRAIKKTLLSLYRAARWVVRLFNYPLEDLVPPSLFRMSIGQGIMGLRGQTHVLAHRLSELLVPTLLVWGAWDYVVPARHAHAAAKLIPNCQVHVFRRTGHSVYKRKLEEFSQLVVRFLGR
jgi:pimeloyl-ACP methyl ester carboxylesterase